MRNQINRVKSFVLLRVLVLFSLVLLFIHCKNKPATVKKPNVLFIAIDDLNDWIGCMGGHPQAKTPHIDYLASKGMLFTNAHTQAPVCNPSRASIMTSLYPSTSGIYFLKPSLAASQVSMGNIVMPKRFEQEGYSVLGAGKLFHNAQKQNENFVPNYEGGFGGFGPLPNEKITSFPGLRLWDWGAFPDDDSQTPDAKIADWAVEHLDTEYDNPFWMGIGFYRPHVPQFAPQKWFDLYPLETVQLPKTIAGDLADISSYGTDISRLKHIAPTYEWVLENDTWKPIVQSYLACVSFVDHQVGKVIKALEKGEYADNTYIVLFSDHGFHLGEKERFAKRSLWEDATRVPLIIVGPGISPGKVSHKPVQLLDIYPTLLELTGHESDSAHEGNSLAPILKNPVVEWPHISRTSFGPGNYAIVSERYRFIQYIDGSEEFYDHTVDPHEWNNIIQESAYSEAIEFHRKQIPSKHHKILGEESTGHLSYKASQEKIRLEK